MPFTVTEERFDELVDAALDALPSNVTQLLTSVVILVRDANEEEPTLLGLYEGIPLTERTHDHTGYLPDTIFVYKQALEQFAEDEQHLAEEVKVTLFHEVAHYFGIEEERLHELGWG